MKRLLLLSLLLLTACVNKVDPPPLAFFAPGPGWFFAYSYDVQGTGAAFDFPVYAGAPKNGRGVHYVVSRPPGSLTGKTITVTFTLEGSGTLYTTDPNDSSPVAIMRLFIEQNGDHLQASEEFKRWWSNPVVVRMTGPGTYTVTVPITPDQWSSVFGKKGTDSPAATAGFNAAVANAGNVGYTFGGNFAGHGNAASGGPVRFVLKGYTIQ